MAASVGLPIAFVSLAKVALFLGTLVILLTYKQPGSHSGFATKPFTTYLIFFILALFAVSLLWTTGPQNEAINSVTKYGKLLIIPVFCMLIRNRKDVLWVLASFSSTQLFLVISAWMLHLKLPVPWATSQFSLSLNVVFSSYLDEGLMSAVFAAVCWHLRALVPGKYGRHVAVLICFLALGHVLFLLQGRSGHVTAILLLTIAIAWQTPRRYRLFAIFVPFFLLAALYATSTKVQARLISLKTEVQMFAFQNGVNKDLNSSSGIRLHFWHVAAQAISENPVLGSGAGSWSNEFNRIERIDNAAHINIQPMGNPHQEYLLWGVQLGVTGMLLLLALMISVIKDSLTMDIPTARATQSSLLALAVACLFNSAIYDARIGDFFCVVLGLLLALGVHKPRVAPQAHDNLIPKIPT